MQFVPNNDGKNFWNYTLGSAIIILNNDLQIQYLNENASVLLSNFDVVEYISTIFPIKSPCCIGTLCHENHVSHEIVVIPCDSYVTVTYHNILFPDKTRIFSEREEKLKHVIRNSQELREGMLFDTVTIAELRQFIIDSAVELVGAKYGYLDRIKYAENSTTPIAQTLLALSNNVYTDASDEIRQMFNLDKPGFVSSGNLSFDTTDLTISYNTIFKHKKPVIYNRDKLENRIASNQGRSCPFKPHGKELYNFIGIPLLCNGEIIGAIGLANCDDDEEFINDHVELIQPFLRTYTNIEITYDQHVQLQETKKALEKTNESKTSFFSNLSHDLRTPMNSIIVAAELLSTSQLSPQQRDYTACIRSSSNTMMSLLTDLLDMTRLDSGTIEPTFYLSTSEKL